MLIYININYIDLQIIIAPYIFNPIIDEYYPYIYIHRNLNKNMT